MPVLQARCPPLPLGEIERELKIFRREDAKMALTRPPIRLTSACDIR